jgi:hypothetical protein
MCKICSIFASQNEGISVLDRIVDGQAPAKVISKVNQWIDLHEQEILSLWESAQEGKQIGRIEPLK